MSGDKVVVKVTIGGEEYTLKSDRPPEYTRSVAEHVDRTLKDILGSGSMVETQKAAILAALAITDELFQAKREADELRERVSSQAQTLAQALEETLSDGGAD